MFTLTLYKEISLSAALSRQQLKAPSRDWDQIGCARNALNSYPLKTK